MTSEERQQKRAAAELLKREKAQKKLQKEQERLSGMWQVQKELTGSSRFVFGIDEAGRGPLAGPVAAGAVIPFLL